MKKEFIITILAVVAIIAVSVFIRLVLVKNYTKPIMSCVQCINNQTWKNKPCCDADFSKKCENKNGIIRFNDLKPDFGGILEVCYTIVPDTGKACAANTDCIAGFCDLESAVAGNRCTLLGKNDATSRYSCDTEAPGICASAPNGTYVSGNPAIYKLDGKVLVVENPKSENK